MFTKQKKSLKVGKLVNTAHVNKLVRNYKQERWVHNSKRLGKEDSLSVWYSVEELEEFLAKVKDNGGDGVRMFFGAYDKDNAPEPMHAGRQTIVLVATKEKETENGSMRKDVYMNTENGAMILAYNLGTLCPPFCGNTDDPGTGITIIDKGEDGIVIV